MTPESMVQQLDRLVSLPDVYHRVEERVADPCATVPDIARALTGDPAMTARVLGVVNSALYGFPARIESVPMAITIIGTRGLRDLMLGMSIARAFDGIATELVDMDRFWEHAVYCGLMTRALGREAGMRAHERLFLGGLCHDLGKLVMYHLAPAASEGILRALGRGEQELTQLERQHLGCDHAQVGGALLERWHLPAPLCIATRWHHAPGEAPEYPRMAALVHIADELAQPVEPSHYRHTRATPAIDPTAAHLAPADEAVLQRLRLQVDLETAELYERLFTQPQ
ncbi:MAG: HDOD domain-containing protein [Ectothiorhodospiraceae bacterium]